MAIQGKGRFLKSESSRSLIYVSQKIAQDSAFPFRPGQALKVTVDVRKRRLIIEGE